MFFYKHNFESACIIEFIYFLKTFILEVFLLHGEAQEVKSYG